jgi:hypothetical protein
MRQSAAAVQQCAKPEHQQQPQQQHGWLSDSHWHLEEAMRLFGRPDGVEHMPQCTSGMQQSAAAVQRCVGNPRFQSQPQPQQQSGRCCDSPWYLEAERMFGQHDPPPNAAGAVAFTFGNGLRAAPRPKCRTDLQQRAIATDRMQRWRATRRAQQVGMLVACGIVMPVLYAECGRHISGCSASRKHANPQACVVLLWPRMSPPHCLC